MTTLLLVLLVASAIANVVLLRQRRRLEHRLRHADATAALGPPPPAPAVAPPPVPQPDTRPQVTPPQRVAPPDAAAPPHDRPWRRPPTVAPQSVSRDAEPTTDLAADGGSAGPLAIRAASVRGDVHRRQGELRRDAFLIRVTDGLADPVLLSVVAAGRPDGRRSHLVAAEACRSVVTHLERLPVAVTEAWWDGDLPTLGERLTDVLTGVARHVSRSRDERVHPDEQTVELTCLLTELGDPQRRRHLAFGIGSGDVLRPADRRWEGRAERGGRPGRGDALPGCVRPWIETWDTGRGEAVVLSTGPAAGFVRETSGSGWRAPLDPLDLVARLSGGLGSGPDRTVVALWDTATR